MKTSKVVFTALILSIVLITSCSDAGRPEVSSFELGYENSKTGVPGGELHMDAEVLAEGKIDVIQVGIHPEMDHKKGSARLESSAEGWEFDTTYTKFSGLKNTDFHEHIEIPEDAEPGHYHFHFSVTDMEGYQESYEEEFELVIEEK
jgi:hypothetical protein